MMNKINLFKGVLEVYWELIKKKLFGKINLHQSRGNKDFN